MSQLVVITFEGTETAATVRQTLGNLQREGQLRVLDAAVITKGADGTLGVNNELSRDVKVGAGWGAVFGLLVGFLFPLAGIAVGAAGGAVVGAMLKRGVDPKFVEEVEQSLAPGSSALFFVADRLDATALRAALQNHQGKLLQTTLDDAAADQIRATLGEA